MLCRQGGVFRAGWGRKAAVLVLAVAMLAVVPSATGAAPALVITPTISGTSGTNGWYVSGVFVNWDISPKGVPYTSSGCDGTKLAADTAGTKVTCTAWNADGVEFTTTTNPIK